MMMTTWTEARVERIEISIKEAAQIVVCVMATQEMIAATVEESGTAVLQTKSNGGSFVGAAKLMALKVH